MDSLIIFCAYTIRNLLSQPYLILYTKCHSLKHLFLKHCFLCYTCWKSFNGWLLPAYEVFTFLHIISFLWIEFYFFIYFILMNLTITYILSNLYIFLFIFTFLFSIHYKSINRWNITFEISNNWFLQCIN